MKRRALVFGAIVVVMIVTGFWLGRDIDRPPPPSVPLVAAPAVVPKTAPATAKAPQATAAPPAPAVAPKPATTITQAPVGKEMTGTLSSSPSVSSSPGTPAVTSAPSVGRLAPPPSLVRGPANAPPAPAPDDEETRHAAALDVDKIYLMLRDYRTLMGTNPVGTNAEIMKAVMGGNPRSAQLGPPEGQRLNENGELVDRWGTPYFFHQLSARDMEIRSAGPDKALWTSDDIVQK